MPSSIMKKNQKIVRKILRKQTQISNQEKK